MAKNIEKVVITYGRIPTMGHPYTLEGYVETLRRPAKFAPQLIAEGLSEGVSSQQGNLIRSAFDDPNSDKVDGFSNIHSDKFQLMLDGIDTPSVDPSDSDKENV